MNDATSMPRTVRKSVKDDRPAAGKSVSHTRSHDASVPSTQQGPTLYFAWKEATLAKQAIARKLKNIWKHGIRWLV